MKQRALILCIFFILVLSSFPVNSQAITKQTVGDYYLLSNNTKEIITNYNTTKTLDNQIVNAAVSVTHFYYPATGNPGNITYYYDSGHPFLEITQVKPEFNSSQTNSISEKIYRDKFSLNKANSTFNEKRLFTRKLYFYTKFIFSNIINIQVPVVSIYLGSTSMTIQNQNFTVQHYKQIRDYLNYGKGYTNVTDVSKTQLHIPYMRIDNYTSGNATYYFLENNTKISVPINDWYVTDDYYYSPDLATIVKDVRTWGRPGTATTQNQYNPLSLSIITTNTERKVTGYSLAALNNTKKSPGFSLLITSFALIAIVTKKKLKYRNHQ